MVTAYKGLSCRSLVLLAVPVFCLLVHSAAFAACVSTYNVTQSAALNWSAWQVPGGSVTGIISSAGVTSGTGTQLYGVKAAGNYGIKKSGNNNTCATVTFSILTPNCNAPGCTLSAFRGSWNGGAETSFPITSATLPGGASKTLLIGGTATFDNTVTTGAKAPTFTLGIHYDAQPDATFNQTGAITFDTGLTIDTVVNINFGVVKAATAGDFTINTAGTITPAGGGVWLGGVKNAGSLKIHGSAIQTISISAGSYVAGGIGNGVMPSAATCSYNGGAEVACTGMTLQAAPTAAGKTLLLGVKATVDANQTAATAATPSFTVTVTYT